VVSDAVMAPYGREVLARLSAQGQTVVLLIDQTKVDHGKDSIQKFTQARRPGPAIESGSAARRGAARAVD
jgi:hypothetical protein